MESLKDKVIAITGISGIGLAVAKLLHAHGSRLSLADIDGDALKTASDELGASSDRVLTKVVDIRDVNQVNAWIDDTVTKFGRLDGAANMAGAIGKYHGIRDLIDQDDETWDLIIGVNLTGMMYCVRAQLRAMRKNPGKEGGEGKGSIVNASSIQGTKGFPKHAAYAASKHAVIGLSKSVAGEEAPGIRVNCVAPGTIHTPLLDKANAIQGGLAPIPSVIHRPGKADEVAQLVVFLLSDASSYITGSVHGVDGGWN